MQDESYGRAPYSDSKNPFTCGLSGRTFTGLEMKERVEALAKALAHELGWKPNVGTEWDKVIGIFSLNTVNICMSLIRPPI
jgi:ribosome assembly protein SQT1